MSSLPPARRRWVWPAAPVAAVVGGRADYLDAVYGQGIDLVLPICRKPMPLDQALGVQEATTNLICAGEAAAQAYDLARP